MTYQQWLAEATAVLNQANPNENGKIDAMVLLQHATCKSRTQILAFDDTVIDEKVRANLTALLERRLKGEPIAYILGEKEFWSLPLKVSEGTLIPRPDTEILVEQALGIAMERLQHCPLQPSAGYSQAHDVNLPPQPSAAPPVNGWSQDRLSLVDSSKDLPSPACGGRWREATEGGKNVFRILDLGTGTGAIALALASELTPLCQKQQIPLEIIGVDLMLNVVKLAQSNAESNQLSVQFLQSRWFENVVGQFDMIVSNPPYIDENDVHLSQGDVRFEPLSALVAEEEGYADLRHIIEHAPHYLKPNGALLLEHGWLQGEKVRAIFAENHWEKIATVRDYGDNERVTLAFWKKNDL